MSFRAAVQGIVRAIPRGHVATYGQIATLLDRPGAARAVGGAMRACPAEVPWHRVVNARGGISLRRRLSGMLTQRILLAQEGVTFRHGRVVLRLHRWAGDGRPRRRTAGAVPKGGLACAWH